VHGALPSANDAQHRQGAVGAHQRAVGRVLVEAIEGGWLEDQRGAIRDTIAAIRDFTGRKPRGWESPGLTETFETIDLLAEEGVEYVADWVLDDQPCEIATSNGPVVSVPYTVEMNDIAMMQIAHHPSSEWLQRGIDTFDRLWREGAGIPRVMAISVHPYISGVPHRIGYVEKLYRYILSREGVAMWTGEQILDWYKSQTSGRKK